MAIVDSNKRVGGGASNVATQRIYSDLNLDFIKNSATDDISPLKDIEAVKQSVKNLVLTNFFERPFHPEIGGNVTAKLFEPADQFTAIDIRDEIKQVLMKYEPRVDQVQVAVYDNSDENAYIVDIAFNVVFLQIETEVSFNLQRLR
jgi:phage baseplate assembly protein W